MTTPDLDTPGLDTWLARLLHARQRVDLPTLQGLVQASRVAGGAGPTLARTLVERGLLDASEAVTCLAEACADVAPTVAGAPGAVPDPDVRVRRATRRGPARRRTTAG